MDLRLCVSRKSKLTAPLELAMDTGITSVVQDLQSVPVVEEPTAYAACLKHHVTNLYPGTTANEGVEYMVDVIGGRPKLTCYLNLTMEIPEEDPIIVVAIASAPWAPAPAGITEGTLQPGVPR